MKGAVTNKDMMEIFHARCSVRNGARELARAAGVTPQYISAALRRTNGLVPESIAEALGYHRVVVYTPIKQSEQETDHAGVHREGSAPRPG